MVADEIKKAGIICDANVTSFANENETSRNLENFPTKEAYFLFNNAKNRTKSYLYVLDGQHM